MGSKMVNQIQAMSMKHNEQNIQELNELFNN